MKINLLSIKTFLMALTLIVGVGSLTETAEAQLFRGGERIRHFRKHQPIRRVFRRAGQRTVETTRNVVGNTMERVGEIGYNVRTRTRKAVRNVIENQPVRTAVRNVVEAQPIRTAVRNVIEAEPIRTAVRNVVEAQPIRTGVRRVLRAGRWVLVGDTNQNYNGGRKNNDQVVYSNNDRVEFGNNQRVEFGNNQKAECYDCGKNNSKVYYGHSKQN
jgi:hypothetical protein